MRNSASEARPPAPRRFVPIPGSVIYQQGDLILEEVDAIRSDAVPLEVERLPDSGIDLGGGHILYPGEKEKQ